MNPGRLEQRVDDLATEPDRMRRHLMALGVLTARSRVADAAEASTLERLRETR